MTTRQAQVQPPYDVPSARIANKQGDAKQEPGFDPDSPDVSDPEIDPIGPAKIPKSESAADDEKRVGDEQYPPYNNEN